MNTPTLASLALRTGFAVALALAAWSPVLSAEPADDKPKAEGMKMDACKEMKAAKEKLKAEQKVEDTNLTDLLAKLNSSPDDKKIGLMAAILNSMITQRIAMDAKKDKLEEEMMKHMMEHMGKDCPMMKGGGDDKAGDKADDKAADPHKAHH